LQWPKSSTFWWTLGYLQLVPWLIMATGSRTTRVAFVGAFLALLAMRRTRGLMVYMMPSTIAAYLVGFYYQSLPAAIERFFSADANSNMSLSGRFFADTERFQLIRDTISAMNDAPQWVKLIGFGPGTGGYSISGFPEPHNFLNHWAETGVLGIIALVGFFAALLWGLLRQALRSRQSSIPARLLLVALMLFSVANLTHDMAKSGLMMALLLLVTAAVVAFDHRSRPPASLD
jgi:O-antigen ligase